MSVPSDLVPIAHRLTGLQAVRLLITVGVAAGAGVYGPHRLDLLRLAIVYGVATTAFELLRRVVATRGISVVSTTLALDGLFLSLALAQTGGPRSPLLYLVHVHVVAVVLLVTFRTGLVVALWHALLLVAIGHPAWPWSVSAASGWSVALAGASFVVAAGIVVRAAAVNEDVLRRSRRAAAVLLELGTELELAVDTTDVCLRAAQVLRRGLGADVAVLAGDPSSWVGALHRETVVPVASRPGASIDITPAGGTDATIDIRAPTSATALRDVGARLLVGGGDAAVVPLRGAGGQIGVLVADLGDRRSIGDHEQHVLDHAASRIALALRAVRLHAETERLASLDGLTGLSNRRTFDQELVRAVAAADRSGTDLALAMLDVDHFKQVNDIHGHQAGDEVLRQLASALVAESRADSVVARYGGEEFAVILWSVDLDGAVVAGERLRAAAGAVEVLPITVSVGIASFERGMEPEALVAAADRALYEAKSSGRDRVATAPVTPAPPA